MALPRARRVSAAILFLLWAICIAAKPVTESSTSIHSLFSRQFFSEPEDEPVRYVYRADTRGPTDIQLDGGFRPTADFSKNEDDVFDLKRHKQGAEFWAMMHVSDDVEESESAFKTEMGALVTQFTSAYVSTSTSARVAIKFGHEWIYKIRVTPNMIDTEGLVPAYDYEKEMSALGGIHWSQIVGYTTADDYESLQADPDEPVGQPSELRDDQLIKNPGYDEARFAQGSVTSSRHHPLLSPPEGAKLAELAKGFMDQLPSQVGWMGEFPLVKPPAPLAGARNRFLPDSDSDSGSDSESDSESDRSGSKPPPKQAEEKPSPPSPNQHPASQDKPSKPPVKEGSQAPDKDGEQSTHAPSELAMSAMSALVPGSSLVELAEALRKGEDVPASRWLSLGVDVLLDAAAILPTPQAPMIWLFRVARSALKALRVVRKGVRAVQVAAKQSSSPIKMSHPAKIDKATARAHKTLNSVKLSVARKPGADDKAAKVGVSVGQIVRAADKIRLRPKSKSSAGGTKKELDEKYIQEQLDSIVIPKNDPAEAHIVAPMRNAVEKTGKKTAESAAQLAKRAADKELNRALADHIDRLAGHRKKGQAVPSGLLEDLIDGIGRQLDDEQGGEQDTFLSHDPLMEHLAVQYERLDA